MWIVGFACVIGLIMVGSKFKEYQTFKKELDEITTNNHLEVYDFSKTIKVIYLLFLGFGLISTVYGFTINHTDTIAMGAIIILVFISELIMSEVKFKLYYNDTGFVSKGNFVRYKSVKGFQKLSKIPFSFTKVITFNGEEYPVSSKSLAIILEKQKALTKK